MVELEWIEARNGLPTLKANRSDGRAVFLHSAYDPEREAQLWAERQETGRNALVAVFGLGLGYQIRALLARLKPGCKVLICEPHRELRRRFDLEALRAEFSQHLHISVVGDWAEFKGVYSRIGNSWENIFFAHLPASAKVFEAEFREFTAKLTAEMKSLSANWATTLLRGDLWQSNLLRNLRHLDEVHAIGSVFERFAGKPAIIVSTGPSLNKNVRLLRRAQNSALILAMGSSARLLLKKGIVPHLVTTFDGHSNNFENVFKGMPLSEVPLAFDPVAHYQILEQHQGPKVMMTVQPANRWLDRFFDRPIGQVKVGGSIANTTFDLAYRLGADPIIFVGQDLAYTDEQLYATGTTNWKVQVVGKKARQLSDMDEGDREESPFQANTSQDLEWVEGIDGKPVATSPAMKVFLHWFEEEFARIGDERFIVNATEGGARIRGAHLMPLSEALDRYCAADLSKDLQAFRQELLTSPGFHQEEFLDYLTDFRERIRQLIAETRKAISISKKLIDHYARGHPCKVEKCLVRLARIDRKLKAGKDDFALIHYLLSPIELIVRYPEESGSEELDACRQSLKLYRGMHQCFDYSTPLVDELIEAVKGRAVA